MHNREHVGKNHVFTVIIFSILKITSYICIGTVFGQV